MLRRGLTLGPLNASSPLTVTCMSIIITCQNLISRFLFLLRCQSASSTSIVWPLSGWSCSVLGRSILKRSSISTSELFSIMVKFLRMVFDDVKSRKINFYKGWVSLIGDSLVLLFFFVHRVMASLSLGHLSLPYRYGRTRISYLCSMSNGHLIPPLHACGWTH